MDVFAAASEALRTGRPAALVTVVEVGGSTPRSPGARMLVYADGTTAGTIGGGNIEYQVIGAALEALEQGCPTRFEAHLTRDLGMCCGGRMAVFIEPLETRDPFVVFGAGHVARATAPLLADLDFAVTVVDERPEQAESEAFPACEVVCADPLQWLERQPDDLRAFYLVVTHDHGLDQRIVERLLKRHCAWLGLIGSRPKVAKFLIRYKAAGLDESLFQRLSAPVGLDIGAETPKEIAVSIAAEVIRVRRGVQRDPLPLSAIPLPARGGDGKAVPPALRDDHDHEHDLDHAVEPAAEQD